MNESQLVTSEMIKVSAYLSMRPVTSLNKGIKTAEATFIAAYFLTVCFSFLPADFSPGLQT